MYTLVASCVYLQYTCIVYLQYTTPHHHETDSMSAASKACQQLVSMSADMSADF